MQFLRSQSDTLLRGLGMGTVSNTESLRLMALSSGPCHQVSAQNLASHLL